MSDKAELVMRSTADLRRLSKVWRRELLADGEQRSRCWTLGALNDALNRMRASCAPMSASLFIIIIIIIIKKDVHQNMKRSVCLVKMMKRTFTYLLMTESYHGDHSYLQCGSH